MLTLGQAAKETGVSKPTLSKAISTGKLSASRREDGSWAIDPAELCRYHDANKHRLQKATAAAARLETPATTALAEAHQRAALAEQEASQLRAAIEDLRVDRDSWRDVAKRLAIADSTARRPWWRLGRG